MSEQSEAEIKAVVRRFIAGSISIPGLDDDDHLFETGVVNSLFAVQLMTFVEKTFDIEVAVDDLDVENFKSLNATAAFVTRKKARTSNAATAD